LEIARNGSFPKLGVLFIHGNAVNRASDEKLKFFEVLYILYRIS